MPTYPFLSDEWIAEARRIRAEVGDQSAGAAPASVRMNQVITDVPFGTGRLDAHLDTSSGTLEMETGHLDDPDVTVTLDYETAKAIFVDTGPQAGVQAFLEGKIKVQGDMAKLLAMMQQQQDTTDPRAVEVQQRIREITS